MIFQTAIIFFTFLFFSLQAMMTSHTSFLKVRKEDQYDLFICLSRGRYVTIKKISWASKKQKSTAATAASSEENRESSDGGMTFVDVGPEGTEVAYILHPHTALLHMPPSRQRLLVSDIQGAEGKPPLYTLSGPRLQDGFIVSMTVSHHLVLVMLSHHICLYQWTGSALEEVWCHTLRQPIPPTTHLLFSHFIALDLSPSTNDVNIAFPHKMLSCLFLSSCAKTINSSRLREQDAQRCHYRFGQECSWFKTIPTRS
jgi:hypothetical protein